MTQKEKQHNHSTEQSAYDAFIDKFKPKLTTDDCYTPPEIYELVKDWVMSEYNIPIETTKILRPFYPNRDYRTESYDAHSVAIDNPPFSILSKIIDFYLAHKIKFFLFAPHLTLFSNMSRQELTAVVCGATITYENGAKVNTSFLTNLSPDVAIRVAGDLYQAINRVEFDNKQTKTLPKYEYPSNVVTSPRLAKLSKAGDTLSLARSSLCYIRKLDSQQTKGKAIFGGGFLCSDRIGKELEIRQLELRQLELQREAEIWSLSERERLIIEGLGK